MTKLAVIGLDCADPRLVFHDFIDDLPTIRSLLPNASHGVLHSTIPPITVPAWMCMVAGKDPGQLGIYGFRNRRNYTYQGMEIASSYSLSQPTVWDTLGQRGYRSIVLGVPLTYPPRPINGCMVTGVLTPSTDSDYTYPHELRDEIREWIGDYIIDVPSFRTENKESLLADVYRMTAKRFELAECLVKRKKWDFFMVVEMGPDRMHHAFWAHHDRTHSKHDSTSPFVDAIHDYYVSLDKKIGTLLDALPQDAQVLVVSDHGIQPMRGGICINEWLIERGYLVLHEYPDTPTRVEDLIHEEVVDWKRTKAWGSGGYYGRIFLNIKGREPQGSVISSQVRRLQERLIHDLKKLTDEEGEELDSVIHKPEDVYRDIQGIPPDLMVYFGNLTWRSIGSIGHRTIWVHENDTVPDDANHHPHGLWLWADSTCPGNEHRQITDISSMILGHFGIRNTSPEYQVPAPEAAASLKPPIISKGEGNQRAKLDWELGVNDCRPTPGS